MSRCQMYYGEIATRISGRLYQIIYAEMKDGKSQADPCMEDIICDLSADAARVFDTLEDLSGEHFIDWTKALANYAYSLKGYIHEGKMPSMADMIFLAVKGMELARS